MEISSSKIVTMRSLGAKPSFEHKGCSFNSINSMLFLCESPQVIKMLSGRIFQFTAIS